LVGDMKIYNSMTIAHNLEVSQKTAWWMLNKLREARKKTSDHKFVNGQEVLVFKHRYEILDVLLSRTNTIKK